MSSSDLIERKIRTKRKVRTIVTYADNDSFLRSEHERILRFLRDNSYPSLFAKAYVPHRGIYENVRAHLFNDIFIKLDIKDFFNSINHEKLQRQLYIELNKVAEEYVSREQCKTIVSICSCGYPGLPLGLVTSPDLANLYLKGFDSFLYSKLKKLPIENPIYTRYADDLTISFKHLEDYSKIVEEIKSIASKLLKEFHLQVNIKKTQVIDLSVSNHVKITGINLIKDENNYRHISIGKKLKNELFWKAIHFYDNPDVVSEMAIEQLKGMISFVLSIEKEGFSFTYSRGMRQLIYDRGYKNLPDFVEHLPNRTPKTEDETEQPCYSEEKTLYIYKGMIRCHRDNHRIIQSTAILHDRFDNEVELNVEYCQNCNRYLLEYSLFEMYRERYGILIGNIRMVTNGVFDGNYDLALESPLHLSGYNVGQKDNYLSQERHYILARIIHDGIMTKGDVIKYLSYFLRMNGARRGMELASEKWEQDIEFVQRYDMSVQPRVYISSIEKYNK